MTKSSPENQTSQRPFASMVIAGGEIADRFQMKSVIVFMKIRNYVYRTAHVEVLRQRQAWFEMFAGAYLALWWVPAGHIPGIDEARKRLAYLDRHGPTQFAFTLTTTFEPDDEFQQGIGWSSFAPCPAVYLSPPPPGAKETLIQTALSNLAEKQ